MIFSKLRRSGLSLLLSIVLLFALCASTAWCITMKERYDETDVFIKDNKLFIGSEQFFIKGLNYSPQPLGRSKTAGLCSRKVNYEGVFYNACYFEDYFDGVVSDNRGSPAPQGPWWQGVWDRDFPIFQELGANTIRIYHMESFTKKLFEKFPGVYPNYEKFKDYAADHTTFMDTAHKHNIKVIVPIVAEEAILTLFTDDDLQRFIEARVDEIGNHPALLMWSVGNELGLFTKPELRSIVARMIVKVREYTYKKWNRIIPVTTFEVDLPQSYNLLMAELDVDLFATNAGYRDVYMESLWAPDPNNNFDGWAEVSAKTGVPVLVGEFGMHDQDSHTDRMPDWINRQYKGIVENMKHGSLGGLFFEYNEETMKPENQQQMGLVRFIPSGNSTVAGGVVPDDVERKPVVFDALKKGLDTSSFKQFNFNYDEYELGGVAKEKLDLSKVTVKAFGHGVAPKPSTSPSPSDSEQPQTSESGGGGGQKSPQPKPSNSTGAQESSNHNHNASSTLMSQLAFYAAAMICGLLALLQYLM